ncbi:folate family ECF transporter S component [Clostridium amazonitimonense]|uniref:folate family ECF transporter S component n=1 Tax=Clostridium amazonitimonense TaxID=1499689 RepID=UPI001A9B3437|nr:folate family ECF transporter S component [Clostridium amazonitimonense]
MDIYKVLATVIKMSKMSVSRRIVTMALFIAITFVLSRFLSIQFLPTIKISFAFLPIALSAMLFGPVYGGLVGAIEDLIGAFLVPKGPFFPGFTLSAFLVGIIYGLILYKKPKTITRFIISSLLISVIVNIFLNTVWLAVLFNKAFILITQPRIIKALIMLPIEIITLSLVWKYIGSQLENKV